MYAHIFEKKTEKGISVLFDLVPWISEILDWMVCVSEIWEILEFFANFSRKCLNNISQYQKSWNVLLNEKRPGIYSQGFHMYFGLSSWLISRRINRGYYTVARRYEFYIRVARTLSYKWAQWPSEILFLPREHKIHIFELTCNVLFII